MLLFIVGCTFNDDKNKNRKVLLTNKTDSLPKVKCTYNNFKKLFKKVELPYYFNTDSIDDNYNYSHDGELYDSVGNALKDALISQEFVIRWIVDTVNTNTKDELYSFLKQFNLNIFYNDKSYWNTIEPYIKLDLADKDILFTIIYNQTSAVNGGYKHIFASSYTKNGKVISSKEIGTYGFYVRRDVKDEEKRSYWKQTTDITSLKVKISSTNKISVTTIDTREIEMQEEAPVKRDFTATKQTGKKHTVISLE